ncbi:hypothetical protein [Mycobacteroides abscessus]|uniref:hypothetical protein n=1 Tax=Mycobacteroides abscessus TaxID=36809 RepID=UPI0009A6F63E|nr:hypothetical protein [Mycobacteroides abscessus]SKI12492.1 Uncharacterised protein [Mycobacteroides abscessus subsp. massiliense]SKM20995.1 Uncharacterised protein [Mycobacteroides abscessus subsp. massiliense]
MLAEEVVTRDYRRPDGIVAVTSIQTHVPGVPGATFRLGGAQYRVRHVITRHDHIERPDGTAVEGSAVAWRHKVCAFPAAAAADSADVELSVGRGDILRVLGTTLADRLPGVQ